MYLENIILNTFDGFFSIAHTFVSLFVIGKRFDLTAFAFIIGEHLREFLQVVAGDTVGENMYCEACLGHVETRRFHTGRSISTSHVELIDAVRRNESRKRLACKGIAFRLHEDVV